MIRKVENILLPVNTKQHNNGNVLIITLILFLILTSSICMYTNIVINNARNFQSLQMVNQQRLQINALIAYIKYTNANDVLLSDYISLDNMIIDYTVDDMGDYFYINVSLSNDHHDIRFNFDLNRENNYLTRFEFNE